MSDVVHIAPQLPPAIDGVGDYCSNLWRHWPERLPNWKFLVIRGAQDAAAFWPEVQINQFGPSENSLRAALERSNCETAVLHYVGYGFQPKGIPVWLPGAIAAWKKSGTQRRLFTMFHEMYARSSPFRSPFWVAPMARKIIRELVGLSNAWVTSCERYFEQLTHEFAASSDNGRIIPIGSNIPLDMAGTWIDRNDRNGTPFRFVVFGLAKTRLWALERHWRLLRALNEAGSIEFITLLGKHNEPEEEREWQRLKMKIGEGVKWRTRFDLSTTEISHELVAHHFGLLANEPDILTKSGVFAALAGHGTIPIVSTPAKAPLPASLEPLVLANDDVQNISVLTRLRNPEHWQQMRYGLLEFSGAELAWNRITEKWCRLVSTRRPLPEKNGVTQNRREQLVST